MTDKEVSRRAVLAGLCGALALAFAPVDRFMAGLGRMLDRVFGEVPTKFLTYDSLSVTFGGVTLHQDNWNWMVRKGYTISPG